MKPENKRILSIVNELLAYSLERDANKIDCNVSIENQEIVITVDDNGKGLDEETLKYIRRILKQPHRKDMEDYYGNLASGVFGSGGIIGSGLNLVGFQLDYAQVKNTKEGLNIVVKRKINY